MFFLRCFNSEGLFCFKWSHPFPFSVFSLPRFKKTIPISWEQSLLFRSFPSLPCRIGTKCITGRGYHRGKNTNLIAQDVINDHLVIAYPLPFLSLFGFKTCNCYADNLYWTFHCAVSADCLFLFRAWFIWCFMKFWCVSCTCRPMNYVPVGMLAIISSAE